MLMKKNLNPRPKSGFLLMAILSGLIQLADRATAQTIISEFMASNRSTLVDEDDDRSDWIEIYHGGLSEVNLEGWRLTDDPTHQDAWTFPSITLFPSGYLTVFASGKDRTGLHGPLHTDFKLDQEGDYLALLTPEGAVVSAFEPTYPPQIEDVSFGVGVAQADEIVLLADRAPASALIPQDGQLGTTWTAPQFDDRSWLKGQSGVGYDYPGLIALDVAAMRGSNPSVYTRFAFELSSVPTLDRLLLRIRYEDGYVAFLNGVEVAADNDPTPLSWDAQATQNRPDNEAISPIDVDISSARDLLIKGRNVLAIQGLNQGLTSSDLLIAPELIGQIRPAGTLEQGYLLTPTPGEPNLASIAHLTPEVLFSESSRTFAGTLTVSLSSDADPASAPIIHYTTDGSLPTGQSPRYEGPLTFSQTTLLRARSADENGGLSPVRSHTYVALSSQTRDFTSNLPVIILENFASGMPPQNSRQPASMLLFEPQEDRTTLSQSPSLAVRSGIKVRGSSTAGRPKPSLSLEAWNEADQDINIAPLDLPGESDWVLWGPYNFDLTLMHNPFIYELSNQIGRYATRTRFVEVFLNLNGGSISDNDYYGVYALTEKISRDEDRVAVARLFPEHNQEPELSGGYLFKIDRADPGDSGFNGAGQSIRYVYPKEVEIERPERDPQQQYVLGFFSDFSRALSRTTLADGESGYAGLLDVEAAIDHHLLNVLAFNVDALRLSGYFHKPRGGKLTFGPIWDFDRALGSTDGRDNNPRVWRSASGDRGTDFFNYPWWSNLFRDLDFWQRYIDRYQSLRSTFFRDTHIHAIIDSMAAELAEAQVRNLERWNQRPRGTYGGTYQGEINHMKEWLSDRLDFMDSQFVARPSINMPVGANPAADKLSMSHPQGVSIYYTLDGSDPRNQGGNPSDQAKLYTGPFLLPPDQALTLVARALDTNHRSRTGANNPPLTSLWSGPVQTLLSPAREPQPGDLLITEIHYHPSALTSEELLAQAALSEGDFEFLEIRNIADQALELAGVAIEGAIQFGFSPEQSVVLEPGAYATVARQPLRLGLRHPVLPQRLHGPYQGNLSNGGETLRLINQAGDLLLEVTYDDAWHNSTDGQGYSLVLKDEASLVTAHTGAEAWRPSFQLEGSPGAADLAASGWNIDALQLEGDQVTLIFQQPAGISIALESTSDLSEGHWERVTTFPATDQASQTTWQSPHGNSTQCFYRLRLTAQP
ncbi:MAG: hypothetical protein EBU26_11265 [Verrucomicrobia bacterium]|nr:hypothetical protein [Verrucomicrobiota bacterium]